MSSLTMSKVLGIALAELGVRESPAGSNRVKYAAWYPMNGSPWCAMFVSWCFRDDLDLLLGKYARTDTKAKALNAKGLFHKGTSGMQKGDVIFFHFGRPTFEGRYLGISHTGICLGKLADGRFHAVEGNTNDGGSANGGQVQIHYRSSSSIAGYFRPLYAAEVSVPSAPATPGTPPPTPPAAERPVLRVGSTNAAAVKLLQKLLNTKMGGKDLIVDGDFGSLTLTMVKNFQTAFKLEVDGVVGPLTWNKLISATAAPSSPAPAAVIKKVTALSGLRVRSGAGTNFRVLGVLKYGTRVTIIGSSGSWYKINFGSGHGYISKSYVK